jgi:hypothetical protein
MIVLLGWGSLLWDTSNSAFEIQHDDWLPDGPTLKLEFSRVSESRSKALTLVVDPDHGVPCRVAHAVSTRRELDDAITDLQRREGTTRKNIGRWWTGMQAPEPPDETWNAIANWAVAAGHGGVVWTALPSNFHEKSIPRQSFTVENAIAHIKGLPAGGKSKAVEYVSRAPSFVDTPLRRALQHESWFSVAPTSHSAMDKGELDDVASS